MSINRVVLTGRLTRDAELRTTSSGMSVLRMRLAFNDRRKDPNTGDWVEAPNYVDLTLFGNRADALAQYMTRGTAIGVDGRLRWREWESSGGDKRSAIEVVVDNVEFLGGRGDNAPAAPPQPESAEPSLGDDLEGEEIPF